jgi:hypothetical protein
VASLTMPPQLARSNSCHHFAYVEERELSQRPALVLLRVRGQTWSPLALSLSPSSLSPSARATGRTAAARAQAEACRGAGLRWPVCGGAGLRTAHAHHRLHSEARSPFHGAHLSSPSDPPSVFCSRAAVQPVLCRGEKKIGSHDGMM